MKCRAEISTAYGAHACEMKGELFVLSNRNAVFQVKDEEAKKRYSINLSLSKHVITVAVPETSIEAEKIYCTVKGFIEDEYTNSNAQKIYKPSFNCDKAKSKVEIAICQSSDLAMADRDLARLYNQLKVKKVHRIIKEQQAWIKDRDRCSRLVDLSQCLLNKYKDRILSLQQDLMVFHKEIPKTSFNL